MKHVLINKDGQVHATILACPFKYTLPRGLDVYEDSPTMGKLPVYTFHHTQPKSQDDVDMHAMDFALVKDGIIKSVVQWGGAEWCPPAGTILVPVEKWMGVGDHYDHTLDKFAIHKDRMGKADKDKSVAELQAEADSSQSNMNVAQ
jgi:hypothetical protein